MEVEAKFRVEDHATFDALAGLSALGPFRLAADHAPQVQSNRYFDTADGALRQQGFGLRVRSIDKRHVATLKGRASFADGLYERDEWEVDVDDDQVERWPAGEVRDRVLALIGAAALVPTILVHTERRHIYAWHDSERVAEISLDQGTISADGREQPFRELEVELLDGAPRHQFDLLVRLLRERFALVPEEQSKLERGLRLLAAT